MPLNPNGALLARRLRPRAVASTHPNALVTTRAFPSVAAPFGAEAEGTGLDYLHSLAKHDILWIAPTELGSFPELGWNETTHALDFSKLVAGAPSYNNVYEALASGYTNDVNLGRMRHAVDLLRAINPNLVILSGHRYYNAVDNQQFLPTTHAYWVGGVANVPNGTSLVDYTNSAFRQVLYQRIQATMDLNIFDGVFFDWWSNDSDASRQEIARITRGIVGDRRLLVANTNQSLPTNTYQYLNGVFMEPTSGPISNYATLESNMGTLSTNLLAPKLIILEQWCNTAGSYAVGDRTSKPAEMRLNTAMALVFGAYVNYSVPDGIGYDHIHNWYAFWDKTQSGKTLGTVVAGQSFITTGLTGGTGHRTDFTGGSAVYNRHATQAMTVDFSGVTHTRASDGSTGTSFTLAALDGEIFFL